MNEKSELARDAVLSRLRQRHERLTELTRDAERSPQESRPRRGDLPLVGNLARPPAQLAERHAGEGC